MDYKLREKEGRARGIQVEHREPGGPVIRQCKASLVRRLSNKIMVRAGLYGYDIEHSMEILIIVETFLKGHWEVVGSKFYSEFAVDKLEGYYDCECLPCEFTRARVLFMVNAKGTSTMQTELLTMEGTWNNWGRHDYLDEHKSVPLDEFYDGVELPPVEARKYMDEEREAPLVFHRYEWGDED